MKLPNGERFNFKTGTQPVKERTFIMKSLNKKAAKLFVRLLDKVKDNELIIENPEHKPLRMEKLAKISTKQGVGYRYTIGVLHDELKLTYSTMMEFIVVDQRGIEAEPGPLFIFPVLYRDDVNGVQEDSVPLRFGQIDRYIPQLQTTHVNFAYQWLLELQTVGYFK
jgi:hypothetical protein